MGEKNRRTKEQEEEQKVTQLWISSNEFDSTITWTECDNKTDTDRQRSRVREIEKQTHAQRNMEMEKKEREMERGSLEEREDLTLPTWNSYWMRG